MEPQLPIWMVFVLASLATFRLATMIALEQGPAWIFRRLRLAPPPKSATREGLQCPLCVGVHIAAIVTVGLHFLGYVGWPHMPLWWMAISGAAVCLHFAFTKDFLGLLNNRLLSRHSLARNAIMEAIIGDTTIGAPLRLQGDASRC